MNKKNFIKILQNPENLTAEELSFLDEINRRISILSSKQGYLFKDLEGK